MENFGFKIEGLNLVIHWDLQTKNKACDLCRKPLLMPSVIEMKCETTSTDNGLVSVGDCEHAYHKSCIDSFLKENSSTMCPICKTVWKTDKTIGTGVLYT